MSWKITSRPKVERDIEEAAVWYEEQQPLLGERFLDEVRVTFEEIRRNPFLTPILDQRRGLRSRRVQGFPYRAIYRVQKATERIDVIAVIHDARNDRAWTQRLR